MAKFLMLVLVLAAIFLLLRASSRRGKPPPAAPGQDPEAMTQCAHCGLHFPRAESLDRDGRNYCCEDHRRLGARP